jgi:23S rRNA (cytidine1920-2'-O)/16S rRNA (cytidine1409-2'-O)-methyltransferase
MDKILPFIHPFLKQNGFVITVIKPHLEVSKENLKNNGTVRNTLGYPEMFESLIKIGATNNLKFIDQINSPIVGKDGQEEFILLFNKL